MWRLGEGSGKAWGEDHRRKAPAKGRVWGRGEVLSSRWRPGLGLGLRLGLGVGAGLGVGGGLGGGLGVGVSLAPLQQSGIGQRSG